MTEKRKYFNFKRSAFFFLAASLAVIPALFSEPDAVFVIILGNYLLVIAVGYWCVAWFSWLKQDGLALLNQGTLGRIFRQHADEWKEKIPLPGSMEEKSTPVSADAFSTMPSASGKKKNATPEKTGIARDSMETIEAEKSEVRRLSIELALAGTGVFLVSLLLQYLVPEIIAP